MMFGSGVARVRALRALHDLIRLGMVRVGRAPSAP
jgi:hypothetical protein